MKTDLPIGLFDSGVGGLTVLKQLTSLLPQENVIYLADTAHLPYGEKSPDAIVRYTLDNSAFLYKQKIKLLIIACHTASSHALQKVQQKLSIPVLGMVSAAIQELSQRKKAARIAILATTSTIESGIYPSLLPKQAQIFPIACPLFVPLIEEKQFDPKAFSFLAEHYLAPLKKERIDTVLLACTHYPLIRSYIQTILGPEVTLIDPAQTVALQARQWLADHNLLSRQKTPPQYEFYATDHPEKFLRLSRLFFDGEMTQVHLAKI